MQFRCFARQEQAEELGQCWHLRQLRHQWMRASSFRNAHAVRMVQRGWPAKWWSQDARLASICQLPLVLQLMGKATAASHPADDRDGYAASPAGVHR